MCKISVLLSLILFQTLLTFGSALMCYECVGGVLSDCYKLNSTNNPKSESEYAVDCQTSEKNKNNPEDLEYVCLSYTETFKKSNLTVINRRCLSKKDEDFCTRFSYAKDKEGYLIGECKRCSDDYCNVSGSERIKNSFLFFVILAIVKLF